MPSLPFRLALSAAAALALGLALGCGPADRRVQVIYYFQAGSEATARQRPALQALETEFPGQVVVRAIDASNPDAQRDLKRLGFATHGLIVRDHGGVMLYKQSGDDFNLDEIRSTLRQSAGAG
jgi:hypothetical protein